MEKRLFEKASYLALRLPLFAFAVMFLEAHACLDAPLPKTPSGPTWTVEYRQNSVPGPWTYTQYTVWRYTCPSSEPIVLVTVTSLIGSPYVCRASIYQSGYQFDDAYFLIDPSDDSSAYCDNIPFQKETFALKTPSNTTMFDPHKSFLFGISGFPNHRFSERVGAFSAYDYNLARTPRSVQGSLSGSWFDPSRDGEGFVLEISEAGEDLVLVAYWFTHREGAPFWVIGTSVFERGTTKVSVNLSEYFGTGFGPDFNREDVSNVEFGVLDLEFFSCSEAEAGWQTNTGESGSFNLRRITEGLEGVSCK